MAAFHGKLEELKAQLGGVYDPEGWVEIANGVWRSKTKTRAGVNWSSTRGTIWFDGPSPAKGELEAQVEEALHVPISQRAAVVEGQKIFVVHGHDQAAREQLELILRRLNLEPFVLQDTGGGGKTIIEALEMMIGKDPQSSFGIVLLTPDDIGYSKTAGEEEAKPRARQNVILEMGMLLSSLTRARVAILQKGFIEPPSDLEGVLYIPFNDHVRETVPKLAQRLEEAGIHLDAAAIMRANS